MHPVDAAPTSAWKGMSRRTFEHFRELIYRLSGISLSEGKVGLVRSRVGKRMRTLNIVEYDEYFQRIVDDPTGEEIIHLLDVISTNVTSFFREETHFTLLTQILRRWGPDACSRLRMWSTACSTGEEPYTMAMTVLEATAGHPVDLKILATDLSTRVLDRARSGLYGADRAAGIPRNLRDKYFIRDLRQPSIYRAGPEVRRSVTFARLNLAQVPFPMSGPFDVVFCRNVMIYFDADVRRRLLGQIQRLLRPGGYLFVGHSESLSGLTSGLKSVQASVYVKS